MGSSLSTAGNNPTVFADCLRNAVNIKGGKKPFYRLTPRDCDNYRLYVGTNGVLVIIKPPLMRPLRNRLNAGLLVVKQGPDQDDLQKLKRTFSDALSYVTYYNTFLCHELEDRIRTVQLNPSSEMFAPTKRATILRTIASAIWEHVESEALLEPPEAQYRILVAP